MHPRRNVYMTSSTAHDLREGMEVEWKSVRDDEVAMAGS